MDDNRSAKRHVVKKTAGRASEHLDQASTSAGMCSQIVDLGCIFLPDQVFSTSYKHSKQYVKKVFSEQIYREIVKQFNGDRRGATKYLLNIIKLGQEAKKYVNYLNKLSKGLLVSGQACKGAKNLAELKEITTADLAAESVFRSAEIAANLGLGYGLGQATTVLMIAFPQVSLIILGGSFIVAYAGNYGLSLAIDACEKDLKPSLAQYLGKSPQLVHHKRPSFFVEIFEVQKRDAARLLFQNILRPSLFTIDTSLVIRDNPFSKIIMSHRQQLLAESNYYQSERFKVPLAATKVFVQPILNEAGDPGLKVFLQHKFNAATRGHLSAEVSKSTTNTLQAAITTGVTHEFTNDKQLSLGAKIGFGAGGAALGLTAAATMAETTLGATAVLGSGGFTSGALVLSTANPIGIGIIAGVLAGVTTVYVAKTLKNKLALSSLPLLDPKNNDARELAKLVRKYQKGPLTREKQYTLIGQIEQCERQGGLDSSAHYLLQVMKNSLKYHSEINPAQRWYREHDFEQDEALYVKDQNTIKSRIQHAISQQDFSMAEQECLQFRARFGKEDNVEAVYQALQEQKKQRQQIENTMDAYQRDPEGNKDAMVSMLEAATKMNLPAQELASCWFLLGDVYGASGQKDLLKAIDAYQQGMRYEPNSEAVQQTLQHRYYQLATLYYDDGDYELAQETVLKTIDGLSTKNELSEGEITLKNHANCLFIFSEIEKPIVQQSTDLVISHLNEVSLDMRPAISEAIDYMIEQKISKVQDELNQVELDETTDIRINQDFISGKSCELRNLQDYQYNFRTHFYQLDKSSDYLFLKTIMQAVMLEDIQQISLMINDELTNMDTPQCCESEFYEERLLAVREAAYYLGYRNNSKNIELSMTALKRLQSERNFKNEEKAICYFYAGKLLETCSGLHRGAVLENYKRGFELDQSNYNIARSLANEYCQQLSYGQAKAVLKACKMQGGNKEVLSLAKGHVQLKENKLQDLGLKVFSNIARTLMKKVHSSPNVSQNAKYWVEKAMVGESFVTTGVSAYLHSKQRDIMHRLGETDIRYKQDIPREQLDTTQILMLATVVLQVLSMINDASYSEENKEVYEENRSFIESSKYGVDAIAATVLTSSAWTALQSSKLLNIPLRELDASQFINLSAHLLDVTVPVSSFLNSWYFSEWRKNGEAPTSVAGVACETMAFLAGNRVTLLLSVAHQHKEILYDFASNIVTYCPEQFYNLVSFGVEQAGHAVNATVTGVSTLWVSAGLVTKAIIVTSGVAIVVGAGYGGYRYYHYQSYNNGINNAEVKIRKSQAESEPEQALQHLKNARDEIETILGNWPEDPLALYFSDQVAALMAINDNNPKMTNVALGICNKRITENEKDVAFRKIRLRAIEQALFNPDLSISTRENIVEILKTDSDEILKIDSTDIIGYLARFRYDEIKGELIHAISVLETIVEKCGNVKLEELNHRKNAIQEKIAGMIQQVQLFQQENLRALENLLFGSFDENVQVWPQANVIPGDLLWRGEDSYCWDGEHWKQTSFFELEQSQPKVGDLLEKDGTLFKLLGDGPLLAVTKYIEQLEAIFMVVREHFSVAAVNNWVHIFTETQASEQSAFYVPHKNRFLEILRNECDKWKESAAKHYSIFSEGQIGIEEAIRVLHSSLTHLLEKKNKTDETFITQLDSKLKPEEQALIIGKNRENLNRLRAKVSSALKGQETVVSKLKSQIESQDLFEKALVAGLEEIDTQLEQRVDRSISHLWVKTMIEVTANLTHLIQVSIIEWLADSRNRNQLSGHSPLPQWSREDDIVGARSLAPAKFHDQFQVCCSNASFWQQEPKKSSLLASRPTVAPTLLSTKPKMTSNLFNSARKESLSLTSVPRKNVTPTLNRLF